MKYKLIVPVVLFGFLTTAMPVFAEEGLNVRTTTSTTATPSSRSGEFKRDASNFVKFDEINRFIREASASGAKRENQLQNIIKAADAMIANRITALTNLKSRISGDKRLSDDEKLALSSQVQVDIDGLNALKVKIDADTDVTTARTDAKQIVTNFWVFKAFEPKMRLLVTLNNLQTVSTKIATLLSQVQTQVDSLGSQGKDVTNLNVLLTDISAQLTTINSTITKDIAALNAITSTSTGYEAVFSTVKNDITTTIKPAFTKIRTDFSDMRTTFKETNGVKESSSAVSE